MLLNREGLLKRANFEIEKVDLGTNEQGEEIFVYVRQMSGYERDLFEQSLLKPIKDKGKLVGYDQSMEHFRAKLAVQTICDEKGENILRPDDYVTLSKNITAKMLETIVNVAQRLNKITEEDKEALVKNLEAGQADNSNSNSAESSE